LGWEPELKNSQEKRNEACLSDEIELMRQAETLKFAPEAAEGAPDVAEELLSANCWKSCWSEENACWAADKLRLEILSQLAEERGDWILLPDDWPESPSLW